MRVRLVAVVAAAMVGLAACGGASSPAPATSTSNPATSTSNPPTSPAASTTVWLCRPGAADDPCASDRAATAVSASGAFSPVAATATGPAGVDCFYVYPTVSTEPGANADLRVQTSEIDAAVAQASRLSAVCRVWAPMYRQETEGELAAPGGMAADSPAEAVAYASVLSAWQDYLSRDNDGRPFILVGHSQGAAMVIRLLADAIDPDAALRRRLVSAVILGGNVQVPSGESVGGSFRHIPLCTSSTQTGCVIAYSSFDHPPPADSIFSRPGQGVSLQSNQTTSAGQRVACTNPAALGGGSGALQPYFPSAGVSIDGKQVPTPWVTYPGLYSATCMSAGGATWLQIDVSTTAGDPRPVVSDTLGPDWGLHLVDVNIALGNLVSDLAAQVAAFQGAGSPR